MKCHICGKQPVRDNVALFCADPKGTKNRRWFCSEHFMVKKNQKYKGGRK